jgi:hypothetical protein
MEAIGAASAIVGLAIPVFQCAKALRDRLKLVRLLSSSSAHPQSAHDHSLSCSQVASEKTELLATLTEYEKNINLLESIYNDDKERLDQHVLDTDLRNLAEYAWFLSSRSRSGLTRWHRIVRDLDEWLNSVNPNLGKKKLPGLKDLWRSGDLREKLAASNAEISRIGVQWQVWGGAQLSEADCADHHHCQIRLQVCTLVSTRTVLTPLDSVQAGLLKKLLTSQQGLVRRRSRSPSMYPQVETAGFNSKTTRVRHHSRS